MTTTAITAVDLTPAMTVEKSSVAVACPMANRTSPLAVHVLVVVIANGRLPAAVPLYLTINITEQIRENNRIKRISISQNTVPTYDSQAKS